jgi:uncharacterized membrane protein
MANRLMFLGLGAALMYFYDPQAGRRRRSGLKDRIDSAARRIEHGRDVVIRDARNRAQGLAAETRGALEAGKRQGLVPAATSLATIAQDSASAWRRRRWSPAQRAVAGAGGAALAMFGYIRGGVKGAAICALGGVLVARATSSENLADALRGHGILVEKSIVVDAPAEHVFAYWRNLSNLPQWMSHVREVRPLGGDRYHWVVDGPAGVPVEWDSELLHYEENREMTWHSVGDSQVGNVGRIRFEEVGDGTRIHVQMRYMPPGGILGHAVARFFGADPKTEMDDDLARMKAAIETGKAPRGAAGWRPGDGDGPPSVARH